MGAVESVGADCAQGRRGDQGGGVVAEGGDGEAGEEGAGGAGGDYEDGDGPVDAGEMARPVVVHQQGAAEQIGQPVPEAEEHNQDDDGAGGRCCVAGGEQSGTRRATAWAANSRTAVRWAGNQGRNPVQASRPRTWKAPTAPAARVAWGQRVAAVGEVGDQAESHRQLPGGMADQAEGEPTETTRAG